MDVVRLDRITFLPDLLVEGYSSMIWTERYLDPGEFELKTPLVMETWKLLPEMSLISHRETKEVMMVETHSIGKNSEGYSELTIKGRTLEAFAESRYLEGPYPKKKYKMSRQYTAAEAASILLWNCFVNPTGNDVTRSGPWTRSTLDTIPNTYVSDSSTVVGKRRRRWLEGGQMYPQMLDLLRQNGLGIRIIRPNSDTDRIVYVNTTDKGTITYGGPETIARLRFDIYSGVDRRRRPQQSTNDSVIFHHASGHINNPSYLLSVDKYKTMAFVISSVGVSRIYRDRPNDKDLSGLDRRIVWVDGGEPGEDESRAEFLEDLPEKGEVELEKAERVHLFDGEITTTNPYDYKKHYDLGDRITVLAEYDFYQTLRVGEYIRTDDAEGDRGYPGLVESFATS